MKNITFCLLTIFCFATASAQYVFDPIVGPTNVANGSPVTIEVNDLANSAGVTASSTGSYNRFIVSVDWTAGGGNPWSVEAELTFTTTAGSVNFNDPSTGGGFNGNATTLTFEGDLTGVYQPTNDGFLELELRQSFGGSDADWSNIVVTLLESPTCISPSSMDTGSLTSNSVELNWNAGDSETEWDVEYNSVDDFTPGNGEEEDSVNITGAPTTSLSGLTAVTTYYVYYRANCGGANGSSEWAGPFVFETLCDVFTPLYVEDFTDIIPDCWDEADAGDASTGPQDLGGGSWLPDGFANNGFSGAYKINLWLAAKSDWIISPQFDLTGGPFQVDFDFAITPFGQTTSGTLGSDDTVQLLITNDGGASWTVLLTFDSTSSVPAGGIQVVEDLTAYSGQTVQFGILGSEGTVNDPEDNDVFVDNFRVREIPSCQEPSDLNVTNITETTADLAWTANSGEGEWEIINQEAGGPAPSQTDSGISTTDNPYQATSLLEGTNYEFYVRAVCSPGEFSLWVGPFSYRISGPGEVCEAPIMVTTPLPYITTDDTANYLDDYTGGSGDNCGTTFGSYLNGDDVVYEYVPDADTSIDIELSGLSANYAGVFVYLDCADIGAECQAGASNGFSSDDLLIDNFSVTGGQSYYIVISTWAAPQSVEYTLTITENTCIDPEATYQVVSDCENAEQFFIDVNVTSLGDATSLTISNDFDTNTVAVIEAGIFQTGPYPFLTDITVTVSNDQDANCVINSDAIQLAACPPDNDNPCQATTVGVNEDNSCTLFASGTLIEATDSGVPQGACGGNPDDDVWFEFTALQEIQIIQFNNIQNAGFAGIDHALYSGTCDNLTEIYCADNEGSLAEGLTVGETYFVRVFSPFDDSVETTFDICIKPGFGNITTDQTTYTVEELVTDVLIGLDCAEISNITFSTGTNFGEENGIAYFEAEEGSFPFTEGIVMTTGNALEAEGPNDATISSGSFSWPGDDDLEAIVAEDPTNNASIIEFDFVAYANEISFDFFMASEEYGTDSFECTFSDAFAFLLTDENDVTTNLAVIPGTNQPIFVTNVHLANSVCDAVNPEFFGEYVPDGLPPMAFNGRTTVFTASSEVNIGETYHIKLVIADEGDSAFDSGVFLRAGSFDIGEIDLGEDITIEAGTAVCDGEPIIIQTTAENVEHVWFKDGFQIPNETTNVLSVTEAGNYTVQIIFSPTCILQDDILVETLPLPDVPDEVNDLSICSVEPIADFNLNENDDVILGDLSPTDFTITYHLSEEDALNGDNPLSSPYTSVSNPQTIFASVVNNVTNCTATTSFNISTTEPSFTANGIEIAECDNDNDGFADYDLAANIPGVLGELDGAEYNVTFHASQADADSGANDLASPYSSSPDTIFVRLESVDSENCFVTNTVQLSLNIAPITSFTEDFDYEVCPDATSPIIIEATPENYELSEVSIRWFRGEEVDSIQGETGLTLPVLEGGTYFIEITINETGCVAEQEIEIETLDTCVIPQGISPNNDGSNDTFDLGNFRVSNIEIFNRYGAQVYERSNYVDEWFGQDKDGNELPVGTYFYSILFEDGERQTGWVYIQREF